MRHILKIHRSLTDPIPHNPHSFSIRTFNPATDKNQWLELNNAILDVESDLEVKESGIMSRVYNLGYYFGLWRKSDNEARANYYIREVKKLFNI